MYNQCFPSLVLDSGDYLLISYFWSYNLEKTISTYVLLRCLLPLLFGCKLFSIGIGSEYFDIWHDIVWFYNIELILELFSSPIGLNNRSHLPETVLFVL